jgi:hypothetical protein
LSYPLAFKPLWKGVYNGTLTLSNFPNGEYIFNLRGIAEDPLAEDNIVVNCQVSSYPSLSFQLELQAKESTTIKLNVRNPTKSLVEYKVESDVPYVSGPPTIMVPPSETSKYELTILPFCSGTFHGSVTFTAINIEEVQKLDVFFG